jgi:hypothetical protein
MNKTESNVKKTKSNRNKLTNTKILLDSDDELDILSDNNLSDNNLSDNNLSDEDSIDNNLSDEDSINNEFKSNILNKKFKNYKSDLISQYILQEKITEFNSKSIFCYYLWSGIENLDRWELNRKINLEHVKKIYKEMTKDYEKSNEFIFYEPVHLAIKTNSIFYVIDGQHRLLACAKLHKKNKYPIQQIPCVLWFPKSENEFIEIFDKINSRTPLDKTKLFNYKINEIIEWIDKTWGKKECLWGKTRPKINKDLFVEKMRESDSVHKLDTNDIMEQIKKINSKIRGMGRNKRCDKKTISDSVHNHAESIDFFLGYDKELEWIEEI